MRILPRLCLAALVASSGCAVGQGEGFVAGELRVAGCDADLSAYDMQPDFFGGLAYKNQLLIRIQRGGDVQEYNDNVVISVNDVTKIRNGLLGTPIAVQLERPPGSAPDVPFPLVQLSLSLRKSCGTPTLNPGDPYDVVLHATRGFVTFSSILDPDAITSRDTNEKRIEGTFDVWVEDPRASAKGPDGRSMQSGWLRGSFKFFYQRGGPAQPFPGTGW